MKIERVDLNNQELLKTFLSSCGSSLNTFRYFSSRPISCIKNHLTTLLASDEEQVLVAYGHLDKEDGKVWLGICVSEYQQGKGYGKYMMNSLLDKAIKMKINEINLTVDKGNYKAVQLYENFGFKKVKESDRLFFYNWHYTNMKISD